jgi:preprotein translocase subunit SecD
MKGLAAALIVLPGALQAGAAPVSFAAGADRLDVPAGAVSAKAVDNTAQPAIELALDAETARAFARLTGAHIGEPVEISVCGAVAMRPLVHEAIPGGRAVIVADLTPRQAADVARRINSGNCAGFVSPFRH